MSADIQGGTGECLAADYAAVYMISCTEAPAKAQLWQRIPIEDGKYKLMGGTGKCLSNFDASHVWTIDCSSNDPGLAWRWDANSKLWNVYTGRSLVADYAHNVSLNPGDAPGQTWMSTVIGFSVWVDLWSPVPRTWFLRVGGQ